MDNIQFKEPTAYAFPSDNAMPPSDGMTLRDWFAGQALSGMLSSEGPSDVGAGFYQPDLAAKRSYKMADAMISERNKGKWHEN